MVTITKYYLYMNFYEFLINMLEKKRILDQF